MRSPSAVRGADGMYHLVWASGMEENNIGHASTRDFIHWSAEQEPPRDGLGAGREKLLARRSGLQ